MAQADVCSTLDKIEENFLTNAGTVAEEISHRELGPSKEWRKGFDLLRETLQCERPKKIEKQYGSLWW